MSLVTKIDSSAHLSVPRRATTAVALAVWADEHIISRIRERAMPRSESRLCVTELLGQAVVDAEGRTIGHVGEMRLQREGPEFRVSARHCACPTSSPRRDRYSSVVVRHPPVLTRLRRSTNAPANKPSATTTVAVPIQSARCDDVRAPFVSSGRFVPTS